MTSRIGPGRWSATCWALVVLAAVLAQRGAAAEEFLYPHAECESGPWGYIDKTGRIVIPLQFQWAEPFSEGLAAVGLNKKSGFIDSTGRLVIQPRFDTVRAFRSGRASVRVGNDWGFIDGGGSEIIPLSYGFTWFFSGDRASVRVKGRAGAVDLSGQMVVAPEFETIDDFSEGLAPAKRNGKHGYIDKDGKVAIPFEFERAFPFQDGRAVVLQDANGRSGLIDKTGALVASFDFEMVHEFSEGLAVVWRKKKYGAIDIDGNVVISPRFTGVGITTEFEPNFRRTTLFSEGLLPVSDGRAYGYIDRHGRYAIEPQFRGAGPFRDGVAMVQMDATVALDPKAKGWLAGIIDRTGKLVAPPIYEWARVKPGGLVQVKFGERLGYLDSKGRPLTFTDKDIEAYLAKRREQLKPPAQGRAVVAKAGDTEYYLHLPESLCLLDDSQPADRKFIEDRWTESDQGFETRKALKPMSGDVEQAMRKSTEDLRRKSRFIIGCDQLGKLRAGADRTLIRSYITALPTQNDRSYDPSMGAGAFWANALTCGMVPGGAFKWSDGKEKDSTGTVTSAFRRLDAGQAIMLCAMAEPLPACYTAMIVPDRGLGGGHSTAALAAKLMSFASLALGDWMIQLQTTSDSASSPDAFFREYERDRATIEAIAKANVK